MNTIRKVDIAGTGAYVPDKVLTNFDLEKMVDTNDEWITTRTGIKERRILSDGVCTSDMAARAGERALKQANLSPKDLDLIIVATVSPDNLFPSTACLVQHKIGARKIAAFDLSAACTGFIYALDVAWKFIATGMYNNALVIGAEALTRFTDYTDRNTCILFGDGAGAVILQPADSGHELIYSSLAADGSGGDIMILPAGAAGMPATHQTVDDRLHFIKLEGRKVYKLAVLTVADQVKNALEQSNLSLDDLSLIIPHQMNARILEAAAERLGVSRDKIFMNLDKYGNTSAASIPMAFDEAVRTGRLKKGDIVVLVAFGGGMTWGATLIKW